MGKVGQKVGQAAAAGGIAPVAHTPTYEEQERLAAPYWDHQCSLCGPVAPARHFTEAYDIREAHWQNVRLAGEQ